MYYMHMYMYMYMYMHMHMHMYIYIHMYIHVYVYVCVCVCMCVHLYIQYVEVSLGVFFSGPGNLFESHSSSMHLDLVRCLRWTWPQRCFVFVCPLSGPVAHFILSQNESMQLIVWIYG